MVFDNIPGLKDMGLSAMVYSEFSYYPKPTSGIKDIISQTRVSHGFGVSYYISPMLALSIFFNTGNFNVNKGDDPKTGGISLTFMLL